MADDFDEWERDMAVKYHVLYRLECGCATRVTVAESHRRNNGDAWDCDLHGTTTITAQTGVST